MSRPAPDHVRELEAGSAHTACPRPQNPFNGRFRTGSDPMIPKDGLLDVLMAERMLKAVQWGIETDLYTYQQELGGKSGPTAIIGGREFLMASSYDYLGLIGHPAIDEAAVAAVRKYGTGTGGVRLLTGTTEDHRLLEGEIARFKGVEASLTFTSGYLANLGVITALFGPGDKVILDGRAHRSIVDACRLAHVPISRFAHNDLASLRSELAKPGGRRRLVVTEGIFSMDGDICPLPGIVELKKEYGAYLMVDEAHSLGVVGSAGRGVDEHFGIDPHDVDIWMGSLSKAIPSNGGFIAGSQDLIIYLQHAAAAYIFSSALCPSAVAAAREALRLIEAGSLRRERLRKNAAALLGALRNLGYNTATACGPVIPVITGTDESAYRLSRDLFSEGIIASAIVSPAVAPGASRLRLCATAAQSAEDVARIVAGFERLRGRRHATERKSIYR